jgi:hypothetical protein
MNNVRKIVVQEDRRQIAATAVMAPVMPMRMQILVLLTATINDDYGYSGDGFCGYYENPLNCPDDCGEGSLPKEWQMACSIP